MIVVAIVAVVAVGLAVAWFLWRGSKSGAEEKVILTEVVLAPYEHIVLEQGEVESSSNVEIRCEVKSRGAGSGGGTAILWVIPEGTIVNQDEVLVELDSSALDQEFQQQQIVCNTSAALVTQAKNTYETALKAKTEYLESTFPLEEQVILNEKFEAEDALKRAELDLASSKRLLAKGLLTNLQLKAQETAMEKAENLLKAANIKLNGLREFTKEKMLTDLENQIITAKARWDAEQSSHELDMTKLKEIQVQIALCTIKAPQPGTVVYANVYDGRRGDAEFVIEPGAMLRERQVVIRLPDKSKMQIKAKINESRISLVKPDMQVAIRLDAVKDVTLMGEVTKVNQYAEPGGWSSGNVREYAAFIKILNPPNDIRPGMNAEVRIYIEHQKEALQIPVQAVYEHRGHTFCLVKNGEQFETRRVVFASTNDKTVAIDQEASEDLPVGAEVVMNPRQHTGKFDFDGYAALFRETPEQVAEVSRGDFPDDAVAGNGTSNGRADERGGGGGAGRGDRGPSGGPGGRPNPAQIVQFMMQNMDTDGDGVLSSDELAAIEDAQRRDQMIQADTNGDGAVDRAELTAAASQFSRQGGGRPPQSSGGGE
jgi:multidrug efflux pump subunit AcrA (membrane-fusion protein)